MFYINDSKKRNVLVSCDHGLFVVNRFDCDQNKVGQSSFLLDHGNASTQEAQVTYQCIASIAKPVILDIGANIGTYTTWLARAFPNGIIHAFEPQRLVFQMLCANLAINNIDNVFAEQLAISNENDVITFQEPDYYTNEDFGTFSFVDQRFKKQSQFTSSVDTITIDSFVEKKRIENVDFIKIDVEGMEIDVLEGAIKTINRYKPFFLIEHTNPHMEQQEQIVSLMEDYDYVPEIIGTNIIFTR